MTPRGARSVFVEKGEGVGGPITVGPDGNLWFTGSNGGGAATLGRITLGRYVPIVSDLGHAGAPAVTAGPDGNLWLAVSGHITDGHISRVTTAGVVTEFGVSAQRLGGIALGPDGNLWFTEGREYPEEGHIGRITPEGVVTKFATGNTFLERGLHGIASGPDGNLWFTNEAGEVGRITPSGVVTKFSAGIPPESRPYEIAAGPDGNLWFTEPGSKSIGRMVRHRDPVLPRHQRRTARDHGGARQQPLVHRETWSNREDHSAPAPIAGLAAHTAYHFRIVSPSPARAPAVVVRVSSWW